MHSERFINDRLMREQAIKNIEVLDRAKKIEYLPTTELLTTQMVADYYEVDNETIKKVIQRNREELKSDGIKEVTGEELKKLRIICKGHNVTHKNISSKTRKLLLFTKRAVLRIGMLLRDSEIAKKIRTYLLNVYELAPVQIKDLAWHVEREISIRERTVLTEAIKEHIPESSNKKWAYKNYTDLCYKIVFGKTAKKMYEEKGLDSKKEELRDNLNRDELRSIEKIEKAIAVFLELSYSYDDIKDILLNKKEVYQMKYAS